MSAEQVDNKDDWLISFDDTPAPPATISVNLGGIETSKISVQSLGENAPPTNLVGRPETPARETRPRPKIGLLDIQLAQIRRTVASRGLATNIARRQSTASNRSLERQAESRSRDSVQDDNTRSAQSKQHAEAGPTVETNSNSTSTSSTKAAALTSPSSASPHPIVIPTAECPAVTTSSNPAAAPPTSLTTPDSITTPSSSTHPLVVAPTTAQPLNVPEPTSANPPPTAKPGRKKISTVRIIGPAVPVNPNPSIPDLGPHEKNKRIARDEASISTAPPSHHDIVDSSGQTTATVATPLITTTVAATAPPHAAFLTTNIPARKKVSTVRLVEPAAPGIVNASLQPIEPQTKVEDIGPDDMGTQPGKRTDLRTSQGELIKAQTITGIPHESSTTVQTPTPIPLQTPSPPERIEATAQSVSELQAHETNGDVNEELERLIAEMKVAEREDMERTKAFAQRAKARAQNIAPLPIQSTITYEDTVGTGMVRSSSFRIEFGMETLRYQSITAGPDHQDFSFEELRYADIIRVLKYAAVNILSSPPKNLAQVLTSFPKELSPATPAWPCSNTGYDLTPFCFAFPLFMVQSNLPKNRWSTITLTTGNDRPTFDVEGHLLWQHSFVFRAILNGDGTNPQPSRFILQGVDDEALQDFFTWIIMYPNSGSHIDRLGVPRLLRLWVLADILASTRLSTHVTGTLCSRHIATRKGTISTSIFSLADIDYVYAHTSHCSNLRVLVSEIYSKDHDALERQLLSSPGTRVPQEFLREIIKNYNPKDKTDKWDPAQFKKAFHYHTNYEPVADCYVEKEQWTKDLWGEIRIMNIVMTESIPETDYCDDWSPEELRVTDYRAGRGNTIRAWN